MEKLYIDPEKFPEVLKQLERRASSVEGQQAIKKSLKDAEKVAEIFRKARYISWERMNEPMTI